MMLLEALGSALLGLVLAVVAAHRLAHRLPARSLVLATGTAGALFGAFVTHSALGPGNILLTLVGAVVVSAASLSLLLRPARRLRRRSAPA
jgi:ABC-type antimicrobial peptide transport system permease subunit